MPTLQSLKKFLSLCAVIALVSGCAMFTGRETPGQYIDDSVITTRVKADILGDAKLRVLQFNVETMKGVVQLSGFVESEKARQRAIDIARSVPGVVSVKDAMVVK